MDLYIPITNVFNNFPKRHLYMQITFIFMYTFNTRKKTSSCALLMTQIPKSSWKLKMYYSYDVTCYMKECNYEL